MTKSSTTPSKMDFKTKARGIEKEQGARLLLPIVLTIVVLFFVLFVLELNIDTISLGLKIISTPIIVGLLCFTLYVGGDSFRRYQKCHSPGLLFELINQLLFTFIAVLLLVTVLSFDNDPSEAAHRRILFIHVLNIVAIALTTTHINRLRKKDHLFGIYPRILASAERETEEYLDGYSSRPAKVDFPKTKKRMIRRFAIRLMRHYLVHDFTKEKGSFKILFPVSAKAGFSLRRFRGPFSWLRIGKDGKAQVYITPEDYQFLEVPISYHLLCEKVAERMAESYQLFAQGDKKAALEVFKVEKKGMKG